MRAAICILGVAGMRIVVKRAIMNFHCEFASPVGVSLDKGAVGPANSSGRDHRTILSARAGPWGNQAVAATASGNRPTSCAHRIIATTDTDSLRPGVPIDRDHLFRAIATRLWRETGLLPAVRGEIFRPNPAIQPKLAPQVVLRPGMRRRSCGSVFLHDSPTARLRAGTPIPRRRCHAQF
jgi:hypothetical protein